MHSSLLSAPQQQWFRRKKMKQKQVLSSPLQRSENFYATATQKYDPCLQGSLYLMDDFNSERIWLRNPKHSAVTTEFWVSQYDVFLFICDILLNEEPLELGIVWIYIINKPTHYILQVNNHKHDNVLNSDVISMQTLYLTSSSQKSNKITSDGIRHPYNGNFYFMSSVQKLTKSNNWFSK